MRAVRFTWNQRDGGRVGLPDAGFLAQQSLGVVESHNARWLGFVEDQNADQLVMAQGKLLPVLVKAIQELSAQVEALKAEVQTLKGA
jgi:hypothetical protein